MHFDADVSRKTARTEILCVHLFSLFWFQLCAILVASVIMFVRLDMLENGVVQSESNLFCFHFFFHSYMQFPFA